GHTQAAAGVAGIIKMVMAMRHGVLPRTLHVDSPSSRADWAAGGVRLLTEAVDWPETGRPRRAGVSSFGISGTNAHVVLEEAPASTGEDHEERIGEDRAEAADEGPVLWVVSGGSPSGLRGQAARLAEYVSCRPEMDLAEIASALATSRSALGYRGAVLGRDRGDLAAGLAALARDEFDGRVVSAHARKRGKVAFVFPGQGSQRVGMGRELYARFPVFAQAWDEICRLVDVGLTHPLREVAFGDGSGVPDALNQTEFAQPALFAFGVSVFRLLQSWGLRPDFLGGHSVGEIAAAHVSGALSLTDACRMVTARARLMQALPPGGVMVAIRAPETEVAQLLGRGGDEATMAAVNGPRAVVVAGQDDAVAAIESDAAARGLKTRRLTVSHAFHSPLMDPMLAEYRQVLDSLSLGAPATPVVSSVTGRIVENVKGRAGVRGDGSSGSVGDHAGLTWADPEYWVQNVRSTVRFAGAIEELVRQGVDQFVELGPGAVLSAMIGEIVVDRRAESDDHVLTVPVSPKNQDEATGMISTAAKLYVHGSTLDWTSFFASLGTAKRARRPVELPTYAFQRDRYWLEPVSDVSEPMASERMADAEFWAAIDSGDVDVLATILGVPKDAYVSTLGQMAPLLATWRKRRELDELVADCCYEVSWRSLPEPAGDTLTGQWLFVVPAGDERSNAWATAVADRTGRVVRIELPVDAGRAEMAKLISAATNAGGSELAGVLSFVAMAPDKNRAHPAVPGPLALTVGLVQALGDVELRAPLWCVTEGAVSVGGPAAGEADRHPVDPVQAGVWGFGRVVGLEHSERWGGLVDVPATPDDDAVSRLAGVIDARDGEDQNAVRAGGLFGRRLVRRKSSSRLSDSGKEKSVFSANGSVLITGGTGGLGAGVARWLVEAGVPHVVLVSRRGVQADGAEKLRDELLASGARVTIEECDVTDFEALAGVLKRIPEHLPLTGVVHAAGALGIASVAEVRPADLADVLAAKVIGVQNLEELLDGRRLDFFVTFSSIAGVWGSAGEAAYSAANAMLDAIIERRRHQGLTGTSMAWGPWAGAGMLETSGDFGAWLAQRGVRPFPPAQALAGLRRSIAGDEALVTFVDIDWDRFVPLFRLAGRGALFGDLAEEELTADEAAGSVDAPVKLRKRLSSMTEDEQRREIVALVGEQVAAVLGHSAERVLDPAKAFGELGFDSFTALELRNRLNGATGLRLAATVIFDHPSVRRLAEFVMSKYVAAVSSGEVESVRRMRTVDDPAGEPMAIVGMACRYPGDVSSPEDLWDLVANGDESIGDLPADRGWNLGESPASDSAHEEVDRSFRGGFLHGAADFDADFFGISPREALAMDPQQRLLLETSWEALENAGMNPRSIEGSKSAVFIGGSYLGYDVDPVDDRLEGYRAIGVAGSVLSGRVAYSFGFEGPAVTVDTACSSSLVALHQAG
ncbi:SDR family NAD(P)-dependent oxidoreductase, partial [Amycolatopsis sp. NPDC004368]